MLTLHCILMRQLKQLTQQVQACVCQGMLRCQPCALGKRVTAGMMLQGSAAWSIWDHLLPVKG